MASLAVQHLTFTYPEADVPALSQVDFTVEEGEFLLLCGSSGCGKTTLLRHLKTVLTPYGTREGEILLDGKPLSSLDAGSQAAAIGFVLQDPEDQIVTDKVWHELAFGLESLGTDQATMRLRVAEMASYFGIGDWFYRPVEQLSGGQKQLLNLASVMAMHPKILVLDEPTSQLDPIAAREFLETVAKLNRELGLTVILSEHRLEEAMPLADRVAVLEAGKLSHLGRPAAVAESLYLSGSSLFAAMPAAARIFAGMADPFPLTVKEGRQCLLSQVSQETRLPESSAVASDTPVLELQDLWFRYEKDSPDVLRGLNLALYPGEMLGIVGGNGAGKSTALSVLTGALRPYRGHIRIRGQRQKPGFDGHQMGIGALVQSPKAMFVKKTLALDLAEVLDGPAEEREQKLQAVVRKMQLEPLLEMHPFDLSGGEQQRAALAKVLLTGPEILLLDEPTKGMDAAFKATFGAILQQLCKTGVSVLLVTHDIEFCAAYAHRVGLFFDGSIVLENGPRAFFGGNHFYTTAANRLARDRFPNAILAEEVRDLCQDLNRAQ